MALYNIQLNGVPQNQLLYWGRLPSPSTIDCLGLVVYQTSKAAPSQGVMGGTQSN